METHAGAINIDGFRLNYIIEGQGIPALVIGSALFYQRLFSKELRKHFQLTFVDHRGFVPPPCDINSSAYDLDVLVDDVEQIRKKLNLNRFIVIGHSGHAFMALEYAKKYPEQVTGVVLIGSAPNFSTATHEATDAFFEKQASPERKGQFEKNMSRLPELIASDPEKRFVHYCLVAGPKNWYDPSYDATHLWEGVYTNMPMIDYVWGVVFRDIDITKNLESFDLPVFLALGNYDFVVGPVSLWDKVKDHFKNVTIKVFEKSAHYPPLEEPELFDEELVKWARERVDDR
jgi:proline iminopeptidase